MYSMYVCPTCPLQLLLSSVIHSASACPQCNPCPPQIKGTDQENRMEIYEKTLEVLGPEVEKAKQFLRFMQRAASSFTDEVKTLSHPERRRDFISEYYLLTLARLINMFSTLDSLKNMKACINNDLACYRR